jgi:3-oxoacyl-[acyl-carrier protein] reductase
MDGGLSGRAALVTGAARGIGFEIARRLAEAGALVAVADIDGEAARAAAEAVSSNALALVCDVADEDSARRAVEIAENELGPLTILVNNAGICPLTAFDQVTRREWDRVLAINLTGAFLMSQAAFRSIAGAGPRGRIINISSVGGQMGGVMVGVHYAAAKAGLIGLTKSLARLLAPSRGTANAIAPGTSATEMTAAWGDEILAGVTAKIPLGRLCAAEEIAAAALFLAGDEAGFITGATLDVNGGLYLR